MTEKEIQKKCREIIIESLELENLNCDISGDDLAIKLGINSIDALQIFLGIENTFNIQIPDENLSIDLLYSLQSMSNFVIKKRNEILLENNE